jgi:hypothetical protein
VADWVRALHASEHKPNLDHWYRQENYVEVWFEAAAMLAQFEYYTCGMVTLRPFQGAPSISCKWQIAKSLEKVHEQYGLPIKILYFGDYDASGRLIPITAARDIQGWCDVDFDFVRCGLNAGDGQRLGIPENFERPGTFQWEGLPDAAARDLITTSLERYIDVRVWDKLTAQSNAAGAALHQFLQAFTL